MVERSVCLGTRLLHKNNGINTVVKQRMQEEIRKGIFTGHKVAKVYTWNPWIGISNESDRRLATQDPKRGAGQHSLSHRRGAEEGRRRKIEGNTGWKLLYLITLDFNYICNKFSELETIELSHLCFSLLFSSSGVPNVGVKRSIEHFINGLLFLICKLVFMHVDISTFYFDFSM